MGIERLVVTGPIHQITVGLVLSKIGYAERGPQATASGWPGFSLPIQMPRPHIQLLNLNFRERLLHLNFYQIPQVI